jgi:hypothetical protein
MKRVTLIEPSDCDVSYVNGWFILVNKQLLFETELGEDEIQAIEASDHDYYGSYNCPRGEVILRITPDDAEKIQEGE